MLNYLANNFKPRVACEVGVKEGVYARKILKHIPMLDKLYLVDLWQHQPNYKDSANVSNQRHELAYQKTINNIKPWKDKVVILKGYSTTMCNSIPNDSLDFVYIDARHDYKGCKDDINAYWPKVKTGGVMAGHDYLNCDDTQKVFRRNGRQDWSICYDGTINYGAVKGAVNEFAQDHELDVYTTGERFPSWLMYK